MKKLFPNKKQAWHLREFAVIETEDEFYEYMAWQADKKTKELSWVRGEARILGDVLVLTSIMAEGREERVKTMKEVRKELKKLPDWWNKTKYYCIVIGGNASLISHSVTGKPVKVGSHEYAKVAALLTNHGVAVVSEDSAGDSPGISGVFSP